MANAKNFQRKIALLTIAIDLIYTLDFLSNDEKARLTSKTPKLEKDAKPTIARIAFHCAKLLERRVQTEILSYAEKFTGEGKTHDQFCDEIVQSLYVSDLFECVPLSIFSRNLNSSKCWAPSIDQEGMTGKSDPHPPLWIFRRKPIFLVYRVYYRGMHIDPKVFEAKLPRKVNVPNKRPVDLVAFVYGTWYALNDPEKKDSMEDNVEDPMLLEPDVVYTEDKPHEDEIKSTENEDDMMITKYNNNLDFDDINGKRCDVMNLDAEENTTGAEMDPVLRESRLVYRKQRVQQLSELKLRLALLSEIETSNRFTEAKLSIERNKIFNALSRLDLENPIKNRRQLIEEAKLYFELLKDLKRSNVHPQKCDELMTTMYLKLPPLLTVIENTESIDLMARRKEAARLAKREAKKIKAAAKMEQENEKAKKKAARSAKRKERKEKAVARVEQENIRAAQETETNGEEPGKSGWEVVDAIDEVNPSVAGFDMTT